MNLFEQLAHLTTEAINPRTTEIDLGSSRDIVGLLHAEDQLVDEAVGNELGSIAQAVDLVVESLSAGGRLIYVGAGTSGRLGILDASEMPPTYGVDPGLVSGIIAGGRQAVFTSVEGAEDSRSEGADVIASELANQRTSECVVIGLSASGRTPFVLGAVEKAHQLGHATVFVSTNKHEIVRDFAPSADVLICPQVGPEPIAGSTRMKSGTAQKMVINMITTASMVRLGKTYGNVMVDLQLSNEKLQERAKKIVMEIAGVDYNEASDVIARAGGHVKTALVMAIVGCDKESAERRLADAGGIIRKALEER